MESPDQIAVGDQWRDHHRGELSEQRTDRIEIRDPVYDHRRATCCGGAYHAPAERNLHVLIDFLFQPYGGSDFEHRAHIVEEENRRRVCGEDQLQAHQKLPLKLCHGEVRERCLGDLLQGSQVMP